MSVLEDFEFFRTLYRCGTLAETARELGISAAATSKRLSRIEKDTGIQLVRRNTRSMTLTDEGQLYFEEACFMSARMQAFHERLHARSDAIRGTLRINASLGFGRKYMARAVSHFVFHHPRIRIETELSDHPLDLVAHGYDIGIRFGALPDSSLKARRIAPHRRLLAAAPSYLEAMGRPRRPEDLSRHHCIVIKQNDEPFGVWHLADADQQVAIKVDGRLSSNDGESAVRWALDGHGIVQRASWELAPYLRSGELIEILPDYALPGADINAIYLNQPHPPRAVSVLLSFLTQYIAGEIAT